MGKQRKSGRKTAKPDDYFASGPFEFARFGKTVVGRSRATPGQHSAIQTRMALHFPTLVEELNALVGSIAAQIARLPPDRLLHRGWWELAATMLGIGGKDPLESDQLESMRMVDYVQSVIAAIEPKTEVDDISDDDWKKLKADVTTLFRRLTVEYQSCLTAYRSSQDASLDMHLEEFRARAEMLWLNIRGKRYQAHEKQALLDILSPHSDVLVRLFGIDASGLADELSKVLAKLSRGLSDLMEEMRAFQRDTLNRLEALAAEHAEMSLDELKAKLFQDDSELASRRDRVAGEFFGMDLFDVGKNTSIPQLLLDELSWTPGEDHEFFEPGEFRGWPLRIWPIMKRPFIRLNGRVFCFDMLSLFDNFYRVLRRAVVHRDPSYAGIWNERQKAVSEELPTIYLSKLLPGAKIHQPIYYRWAPNAGPSQWHEADGLIAFEDHLFVIEVKAGAFTYTSPANDLAAHLSSLRNLLQAPARQGNRFVDYLESAPEVTVADSNHREIGRLRRGDFRHVTVCAVTLDAFTDLAARAQRFAPLGIDVGSRNVWPISIDDLRVYAKIFHNPLIFLHFIEQRMRATRSKHLDLNDEMDHLGLYIEQNNYHQYADEMVAEGPNKLGFVGFTTPIDDYFAASTRGDDPTPPQQMMPPLLAEIVDFLARSDEPRRAELASFLLDGGGDFRDELASAIQKAIRENGELGRARPLSFYGGMDMTLFVWSPSAPRRAKSAIEHARVVMMANNEQSRRLVELEYSEEGTLVGAHMAYVGAAGLANEELERIKIAAASLRRERVNRVETKGGGIGRNAQCPCGSGKKYKRCHGSMT